jgi:hypothetical protein
MSDIVVTVPKSFRYEGAPGKVGLEAWLAEGDPPGSEWSGERWCFSTGGGMPDISVGERVYVVCEGRLVGYAPLLDIYRQGKRICLIRGGGAVAITIKTGIVGFMGWRYRWWERSEEIELELSRPA